MTSKSNIMIIGGGLAGCEAAWQLLKRSIPVTLYDMRPKCFSPAHKSPYLAELVCSNSLRSNSLDNAVGLLKEEMRSLDSIIMEAADATAVPAGKALAVNRTEFSLYTEKKLLSCGNLDIIREEIQDIPLDQIVIIASGPLTSPALARGISQFTGSEYLYFYDAISPIIYGDSIDTDIAFRASRYCDGEGDYLNCPLEKDDYESFWKALSEGEKMPLKPFEKLTYFDGCLPIEIMAERGIQTLAFGPMKPVGLISPKTGKQPHAVLQLRREDKQGILYNMVGFQTKLLWPEQRRIFRMIPGLEGAEFARYGSIHRNTFIDAPSLLNKNLQLKSHKNIFFTGQITGVEGYVESAAMGIIAGLSVTSVLAGIPFSPPPDETALGSLLNHITRPDHKTFQPMNVNFGLFPPLPDKIPKRQRGHDYAERSLKSLAAWEKLTNSKSYQAEHDRL
jgi:methylenetetrahydrofolate--tRNA-(uracil-5-)-methyltransferase